MAEPTKVDAFATIATPVNIDTTQLELRADYFKSPIDVERLRAHYLPSQVLHADPLVVKIAGNAHIVVLRFGALVFWQCSEAICSKLLEDIERLLHLGPPASEVRDALRIVVEQAEESVSFREIRLQTLTLEHIKMISEAIGQSVALKQSEASVTLALKYTAPIVRAMEARGELIESAQNIVKTVGFTLAVREAILAKLSLFDDPADTWRSERLARLHGQLQDHFDIDKRLASLKEKVTFLTDLNMTMMNLLQTRTSHRLEFIVIILIVIEVLIGIIQFFK